MNSYFSPSTEFFYITEIHGNPDDPASLMPADVVPISSALRAELLSAEGQGYRIVPDRDGMPIAVQLTDPKDALRATLRDDLGTERARRERAGFPYLGKTLQADSGSRERITTAVLAALAAQAQGQAYTLAWRCADNSTLQLDVAGVLGLPVAMAQHSQALHQHCQARKAEMEALDLDGLLAFNVAEGWPA